MEEIRNLHPSEIDETLALGQFAFQFEIAPERLQEARSNVNVEERYGFFVDGQLAAQLTLRPFTVYVNGRAIPMGGVAGVSTWPEHRRGGKVSKLLRHSLEVMRDKGMTVSLLAPFSFAFYRRYGWELCIDRKQYTFDHIDWSRLPEAEGRITRTSDWRAIAPAYEAFASRYTGTIQRSDAWWTDGVINRKKGTIAVYQDTAGTAQGYVIYQVKQFELTVHELVYLTEDARRGLWNFLLQHDSMAKKATAIVPVSDNLPFLLANPRFHQEISPFYMARIVDVVPFFETYLFNALGPRDTLRIRVSDPHAPWNQSDYQIRWNGDSGVVVTAERSTGETPQGDAVTCDIQTLTAMMFGYMRPDRLASIGRLTGSVEAIARWEAAIPQQTPFLYDAF